MEDEYINTNIRNTSVTQNIEADIKKRYTSKKLKDVHIKNFLTKYYEGDPNNTCPNGCKADCQLDCYIEIHQSLINDSNKVIEFKTPYTRDKQPYCCGKSLEHLDNNNLYCTVCGGEYKE